MIECTECGQRFGGPKTLKLHRPQGRCLDPKSVEGLTLSESKVWRKSDPNRVDLIGLRGAEYWEMRRVAATERRIRMIRWGLKGV